MKPHLRKTVALTTIGCKLNQFETMGVREFFEERGYHIVPFSHPADIYVINTCTVTGKSDYRSRQAIRKAFKLNPQSFIIVTGCYAQLNPDQIARIEGVDLILGNKEKFSLARYFTEPKKFSFTPIWTSDLTLPGDFPTFFLKSFPGYTRAFIKIQDGCDASCSYCAVRAARGPNRSEQPEIIINQIKRLIAAGYKEVVLTGIHLGTYGQDLGRAINLARLLKSLRSIPGLRKVRLSSIEPKEFTPELIEEIVHNPIICPHLHIPLQSGDPYILTRMHRDYDPDYYSKLILQLKSLLPELAIGADVIVGFPGEEESHFRNTYQFIQALPISYLHVFSYSQREGTPAARFPDQVPGEIKKERSRKLRQLGKKKFLDFRQGFIGNTVEVLIENSRDKDTGLLKGITDNYIKVLLPGSDKRMNNYYQVRLTGIKDNKVLGEWVST
jgi:threonylcarbamoyladenosine tRNA methylthiotransferase MtaB